MTTCDRCKETIEDYSGPFAAALQRLGAPPLCSACGQAVHAIGEYAHRIVLDARCSGSNSRAASRVPWQIPQRFSRAYLRSYRCPPGDRNALRIAEDWSPQEGSGLYLHGNVGAGKTHLAVALMSRWHRRMIPVHDPETWRISVPEALVEAVSDDLREQYPHGVPVADLDAIYAPVTEVLGELRGRIRDPEQRPEEISRALRECELLVLDDLGAERATDFAGEELYRVLNHRLGEGLPTIITSNYPVSQLAGRMADHYQAARLASRITGACEVVEVESQGDYRLEGGA